MQNYELHEGFKGNVLGSKQLSIVQVKYDNTAYLNNYQGYHHSNPQPLSPVIEGYFPKEDIRKEMGIRKINVTLTALLIAFLLITGISYYFATANEMVLNDLNRQTVVLNDENSDLQNKLDKLKSFNNVDLSMQHSNLLKKAEQVIETPAIKSKSIDDKKIDAQKPFTWAIGY